MPNHAFLPPLAAWRPTRDALHDLARILGAVRGANSPMRKHWWQITLHATARGLTTTPFRVQDQAVELELDLGAHRLRASGSDGWSEDCSLESGTSLDICLWIEGALASHGAKLEADVLKSKGSESPRVYEPEAGAAYLRTLAFVDTAFKEFQAGLRAETSPVQLFPHHFDLAMNWFSGRLVPGKDPTDAGASDEQLGFGFVTGDGSIADAYFYATAYPEPPGWTDLTLKHGAHWHRDGWVGAVQSLASLADAEDPRANLLSFLRQAQAHGAARMG